MLRHAFSILVFALCAGPVSVSAAQTSPVPPPLPAAPVRRAPAPPDAGKCIWERLPAGIKADSLVPADPIEAQRGLAEAVRRLDPLEFVTIVAGCGVADDQFGSAGRRMIGWSGRIWAETKLADRWTTAQLDEAYRAVPPADKAVVYQGLRKRGEPISAEHEAALRRYFEQLSVDPESPDGRAALFYLLSRAGDDGDIAEGR